MVWQLSLPGLLPVLVNGISPLQCLKKGVHIALLSNLHLPLTFTCSEI